LRLFCRLEHQKPASDEVGRIENLTRKQCPKGLVGADAFYGKIAAANRRAISIFAGPDLFIKHFAVSLAARNRNDPDAVVAQALLRMRLLVAEGIQSQNALYELLRKFSSQAPGICLPR